uniref:DegT/DnrJ/EryC1/StrS family aminotransferase n=1 Tax=Yoonia sp. TaxID=2212373 RepID=UPI00404836CB
MITVPVAVPYIARNAQKYVTKALTEKAVSGLFGENIDNFERLFAEFIGVKEAVACSSGTAALHLAMAAHGIKAGDEVLVSSLTNMATFFAVIYCGATPIPVDIDVDTYNLSEQDLRDKISCNTKAILLVHLFGQPVEMEPILSVADEYGLVIFEDCAESHGATYKQSQTGSFGTAGCFSLFANKIVSTGEGGIVTTNDIVLAEKMRSMRSLSFGKIDKFLHEDVGFNYRMDNIKAALGVSQMEEINFLVESKINMGRAYDALLAEESRVILPAVRSNITNVYWMYHVRLRDDLVGHRNRILQDLAEGGIGTRPGFVSYTLQPFCPKPIRDKYPCPLAEAVSYSTFYLPSAHDIQRETQEFVAKELVLSLDRYS